MKQTLISKMTIDIGELKRLQLENDELINFALFKCNDDQKIHTYVEFSFTWSRSVSVSRSARLYSSLNPWALVSTVTQGADLMTRGSALM